MSGWSSRRNAPGSTRASVYAPVPLSNAYPPIYLCSQGIAGVKKENGGVGRAKRALHPHIYPYSPAIPNEPLFGNHFGD
jgi:hypothetical protein